jgi:hypothetical protein
MSNVLSLELVRKRACQSMGKTEATKLNGGNANQRLVERLEAENAHLRSSVVELVLQIHALREDLVSTDRPRLHRCALSSGPRRRHRDAARRGDLEEATVFR